jgi:hypothetical protein
MMSRLGAILQVLGGILAIGGFLFALPALIGAWVVPDFAANPGRWTPETLRPSLAVIALTVPGIVLFLIGWGLAKLGR